MAKVADDDRYQIAELFDWHAHCRQIRFKYSDPDNSCFIVFIMDYASNVSDSSFARLLEIRQEMIREMNESESLRYWRGEERYLDALFEEAAVVDEVFRRYEKRLIDEGLCVPLKTQ